MRQCLVIVPTYNEVVNITMLLRAIIKADDRVDILVVDDSSPDGTARVISTEFLSDERVTVISRRSRMGLGSAYVDGFMRAMERGYKYVIGMDADFSHRPADIPQFLEKIVENDLVIGSRFVKGGRILNWSAWRKFSSRLGLFCADILLGCRAKDLTSGFRCFRTEIFKKVDLKKVTSSGYSFQIEIAYLVHLLGKRITEIPIIFEDRRVGQSKLARRELFKALLNVPKLKLLGKKHPALGK